MFIRINKSFHEFVRLVSINVKAKSCRYKPYWARGLVDFICELGLNKLNKLYIY